MFLVLEFDIALAENFYLVLLDMKKLKTVLKSSTDVTK